MDLNKENKAFIENLDIEQLLYKVRYAKIGDKWMQGQTGKFWMDRLATLRNKDNEAYVRASKDIGWK